MKFFKSILVALAFLASFTALPAMAESLHSFAKAEWDYVHGGAQVTQSELAADPSAYFRSADAYATALWYLGTNDAGFKKLVANAAVVDCVGDLTSLAYASKYVTYKTTRACLPGEKLLVQKSTGRVLLSTACENLAVDMFVTLPKSAVPATTGGSSHNPPPPPPPTCEEQGNCEPPTCEELGNCEPPSCEELGNCPPPPPPPPCGCDGHDDHDDDNDEDGHDNHGNNGWGNGDQDAPGGSGDHNGAENDTDGGDDPSHGGNKGGKDK